MRVLLADVLHALREAGPMDMTSDERAEVEAELAALKEKRYELNIDTRTQHGHYLWVEACERADGEIARLERLLK